MPSRDIPREQWVTFLDSFSRQHEGWLVNVEVVTDGLGAHREVREKRLIGVSADLKNGSNAISIIAGDRSDDHVNHIINGATRIALEETEEGAHKGLRIEAADGGTTLLLFRSPASPETVDGVLLR
ncbi:MAG TPA: DUF5335 family protein [Casimicrobiaceae bacterium]